MKGLENHLYLIAFIISNVVALVLVALTFKYPKIARGLFVLIFGWASWVNWNTALHTPKDYLGYADLALLNIYKQVINGWFSSHILVAVGFIATCQGLIAVSLMLKGWVYKLGCLGAVAFLLAIMPLGVGAAFPATFIMAVAMALLLRNQHSWIWQTEPQSNRFSIALH